MKYHHFETLGSTNDQLIRMAEGGAPEWTVVVADRQTSGRGRRKRDWWSPEGNLHMSILLRPEVSPQQLLRLPLIASLAFLSAMGESGPSLTVKWPNDILFNGGKLAGILTESRSEGDKVLWVVVGFGVNMIRKGAEIPVGIMDRIAFVGDLEENPEPGELAVRIAHSMKVWAGGMEGEMWQNAMEEWTRHAIFNVPYTIRDGEKEMEGIPVRLDNSGGLVMKTADGEVTVFSGEINKV